MPKRLIACCDGTWNSPDQKDGGKTSPTNVARLALCVLPRDQAGTEQRMFYDKGVGTGGWWDRLNGGATGAGLSQNVKDAYRFLATHYEEGDEIFLFGFSRGAYTARSTAGFVRNCGLLRREHLDRLDEAFALYRRRDDDSHPSALESRLFRASYSREVRVRFIGVWDTVGSLGIPLPWWKRWNLRLSDNQFHDVSLSSSVDAAYQALAIDEKRAPFAPTLWEQKSPAPPNQVLEQVWFAGVHSDVGGGYGETGLSDLALEWMCKKAQSCGLALDLSQLDALKLTPKPDPRGVLHDSYKGAFRLTGKHIRPIGLAKSSNETASGSALTRYNDPNMNYRPENLEKFLTAAGKGVAPPTPSS